MHETTIAAIASPLGEGGIGVIRLSGKDARRIAARVFFSVSGKSPEEMPGYTAAYGEIRENGEVIDDAVALVFRAPRSYTGEDVVELSLHGGRLILQKVLRLLLQNGAAMAKAGEFTERAFLNGKLDLAKAESIMGLISAKNEAQLKISRSVHNGVLSAAIHETEHELTEAAAAIAAYTDYPDEELDGVDPTRFSEMLCRCGGALTELLASFDRGRVIREGIDAVIAGKPNVGKSTVMNMLSGFERSIVTEVAGTTRDIVEEAVNVGSVLLRLSDTAGIHETGDPVEQIGVARAHARVETAGLILAVFDGSRPLDRDDRALLSKLHPGNCIAVINKHDLDQQIDLSAFQGFETVFTAAKAGQGLNELTAAVEKLSGAEQIDADAAVLINERQRDCVSRALCAVNAATEALRLGHTVDAVGVCIDDAISALGELTGKRAVNEVADEIFRSFCVGK